MARTTIENLIRSINEMNIPDLAVDRDYARDQIVLTNMKNGNRTVVGRTELEDTHLPYSVLSSAIETIMPSSIAVTAANPGTISVNSGGGAGFGAVIRPAINEITQINPFGSVMTAIHVDDPHRNMKSKLFSFSDERRILDVKQAIKALLYDTVPMFELDMHHIVVAGGCFASMLNQEPVKDYDVFLLDNDRNRKVIDAMAETYADLEEVRHGNSNYMSNDKIERTLFFKKTGIQYITTKYKTRQELINHFDFKHCQVSYDFINDRLYMTRETYDLIRAKRLKANEKCGRGPAQWRFEKFYDRGWTTESDGGKLELESVFESL